jgi:hypothetical protein
VDESGFCAGSRVKLIKKRKEVRLMSKTHSEQMNQSTSAHRNAYKRALLSMILSIVSLFIAPVGIALALIGLILSIGIIKVRKQVELKVNNMAIAGLLTGIIGVGWNIMFILDMIIPPAA